ncbi:MAG: hypothetical protein ACD_5C00008G0010 [uncultured bacterium]|nr:MAG: hypothetical protein ACD_5C00008G0010 [uncultured bacterium]
MLKKRNEVSFKDLKKSFRYHKKKAGDIKYVACFGKTFLEKEHDTYDISLNIGKCLIENGFGVLHGGYSGAMEAVSKGAEIAIQDSSDKNNSWNIGVPMEMFDRELNRSSKINLPPAKDIVDRKKALTHFCDACVVLPSGGIGTVLEAIELFHLNQLAEKFGGEIKPIIFIGKHWKELMDNIMEKLDMEKQKGGEEFTHFIDSVDQLVPILNKI